MGIDRDFGHAFAKSQIASGTLLPEGGTVFISVRNADKVAMLDAARRLIELGFRVMATRGTAAALGQAGLEVDIVNKVQEGRPHVVDAMTNGDVQLVINTSEGAQAIEDSFTLRRTALMLHIPYYTTVAGAKAALEAITSLREGALDVSRLQSYSFTTF